MKKTIKSWVLELLDAKGKAYLFNEKDFACYSRKAGAGYVFFKALRIIDMFDANERPSNF
jgi:hypothetical protein